MSLTTGLDASLSSIKLAQEAISLAGHNIANANTENFVRQDLNQSSVSTGGKGQGVKVVSIDATIDIQLASSIRDQSSTVGNTNIKSEYYERIQALYGQPGNTSGLNTQLDNFFEALQNLSVNPELSSLRQDTLSKANGLVDKISNLASDLEKIRFNIDQEIKSNLNTANNLLSELYTLNAAISQFPDGSSAKAEAETQRNLKTQQLAEITSLTTFINSDNQLSIATGNGVALLDDNRFQLNYIAATSAQTFIDNGSLNAITVTAVDDAGNSIGTSTTTLVSSGTSSNVTHSVRDGKLKALLDLRDTEIPRLLEQLDMLAKTITNEMNALHNNGASFPPPQTLTSQQEVVSTTQLGFSGEVMIAVLGADGKPVSSPYGDETFYRPLTLDLGSLDSGSGAGYPDMQTIMDEINEYYGPVQNRVSLGNVRDIKLAAISDTISDEGTFNFDLQLDNTSTEDATVEVLAVDVIDPIDASTVYSVPGGSLPSAYTLNKGDRERTGSSNSITVDFSGDDDRSSYTIRVQVRVTDETGNVSTAEIDYTVAESPTTSIRNDRYAAQAVNSGTATFIASPSATQFAQARIVDSDGNAVPAGTSGYLQIKGTSSSYRIAISELDSQEIGAIGAQTEDITNRGFSHFFGLNNFFTENSTLKNSAINMAVRPEIAADQNKISIGRLALSTQPSDPSEALYTYELGSGNNQAMLEMATLDQTNVSFDSAGLLPQTSITFSGYISDIISYSANEAKKTDSINEVESLALEGFKQTFQKKFGVNVDEQLSAIIEIENVFRASSRLINVIDELLQSLISSF